MYHCQLHCCDGNIYFYYVRVNKMEVDLIFKIAGIGIVVAVLNQILSRTDKSEYAMLTTLAGIIAVFLMVIPEIKELFTSVKEILDF